MRFLFYELVHTVESVTNKTEFYTVKYCVNYCEFDKINIFCNHPLNISKLIFRSIVIQDICINLSKKFNIPTHFIISYIQMFDFV